MTKSPERIFPYAEQVIGYRLNNNTSRLASRVEDTNSEVVELTHVWSGSVQRVQHVSASDTETCLHWVGTEPFLKKPENTTLLKESNGTLSVVTNVETLIALDVDTVIHIKNGLHHTVIRRVHGARRVMPASDEWIDLSFLAVLMVSAAVGTLIALLIMCLPSQPLLEAQDIGDRFARVMLLKEKVKEVKPKPRRVFERPKEESKSTESAARQPSRKPGGDKRLFGDKTAKKMKFIQSAGLLPSLNQIGFITSTTIPESVFKAIGGIKGGDHRVGQARLGHRGGGFGDGPGVDGSVGTLQTGIGREKGYSASDLCKANGLVCGKATTKVSLDTEHVIQIGSLSRAEVDAVVKSHLKQIKYCYQKEVQKTPSLTGKLTTRFTISKDGSVGTARVAKSTLENSSVDRCVLKTLFRMNFPQPRGGGHVMVTYPFSFEAI